MADIRKPALPNGGSATLTPRAQKGLSERECVDRVVGGDIKPVFGGDERLKMVQTAHCLRRSCERLAAEAEFPSLVGVLLAGRNRGRTAVAFEKSCSNAFVLHFRCAVDIG
jgi:hypothetical protein